MPFVQQNTRAPIEKVFLFCYQPLTICAFQISPAKLPNQHARKVFSETKDGPLEEKHIFILWRWQGLTKQHAPPPLQKKVECASLGRKRH